MPKPSDPKWNDLRNKVLGLGERSLRKSHYPELRQRLGELERFRDLLDLSPDALVVLSVPSNQVVQANHRALCLFGKGEGEELDFFAPFDEATKRRLKAHLQSSQLREIASPTFEFTTGSGKEGEEECWEGRLTLSAHGDETYALVILRDLTDRKKLETSLRRSQTLQALGQLASGVAHDFNNLLTSILGNSELLTHLLHERDEGRSMADAIFQAAQQASALTSRLLDLARQKPKRERALDLNRTILELRGLLEPTLYATIELRIEPWKSPLPIRGDEGMIRDALLNLCINGRDAMPHGGRLTLATDLVEHDGSWARVSVIDDGVGIPETDRERIFEPYFSSKAEGKGTGLGLASVQVTATDHGARLAVHSSPGKGSRFEMLFPLRKSTPERLDGPPRPTTTSRHGEHVLVIDDEDAVRNVTARLLRSLAYRVTLARDGQEGLRLLGEGTTVDLIMLDLVMPRLDGRGFLRELQARERRVPVLVITGLDPESSWKELSELGATALMHKPFTREELASTLRRLLDEEAE